MAAACYYGFSLTFPPPFAVLKKSNKYQHTTAVATVLWVLKVCVCSYVAGGGDAGNSYKTLMGEMA